MAGESRNVIWIKKNAPEFCRASFVVSRGIVSPVVRLRNGICDMSRDQHANDED